MNYLAHLYFSDSDSLAWTGSLLGDFLKGPVPKDAPRQLRRHLVLHRKIDTLTQRSPAFQASRRRLAPHYRHGRSVLVDVFYDHFLAQQWENYHPLDLVVFSEQVYAGLHRHMDLMPLFMQQVMARMIEHNWLTSYQSEDVVARVLLRLEQRLKHRLPLADGITELRIHRAELEKDFSRFMHETKGFVVEWKKVN